MRVQRFFILQIMLVFLLAGTLIPHSPTKAATYTVTDAVSLIAAINAANLSPEDDLISLSNDITLTSVASVVNGNNGLPTITTRIIIQGNGHRIVRDAAAPAFRLLHVSVPGALWLDNVTLAGGSAVGTGFSAYGGAVFSQNILILTRVTVGGSVVNANTMTNGRGGGIYGVNTTIIVDSNISRNHGTGSGAGIAVSATNRANLTLVHSTIENNTLDPSGGSGAGLHLDGYNVRIIDSQISNNTITNGGAGGGIYALGWGNLVILNSSVNNNVIMGALGDGGGINIRSNNTGIGFYIDIIASTIDGNQILTNSSYARGGGLYISSTTVPVRLVNSSLSNNIVNAQLLDTSSTAYGGGMMIAGTALEITSSSINNNTVRMNTPGVSGVIGGGGINTTGNLRVTNTTISGNTVQDVSGGATLYGGGVLFQNGTFINSTIANNRILSGGNGGGINGRTPNGANFANTLIVNNSTASGLSPDCYGSYTSQTYNYITNTAGCTWTAGTGDILNTPVTLSPLANNGGLTLTHAITTIPPIDSGNPNPTNGTSYNCLTTDQRGAPRGGAAGRCDIGAYESNSTAPVYNVAPVGADDLYTTTFNTVLNVATGTGILINDSDSETITSYVASAPSGGFVTVNSDGSFTYTPFPSFSGTDSFTYRVCDARGMCDATPRVVTINVGTPSAPVANPDSYNTPYQTTLNQPASGVLANDTGTAPLTAVLDTTTTNGTLTLNSNGSFSYTPNAGFSGTDTFTYHAVNGFSVSSPIVTVQINVSAPPIANADSYTTPYQTTLNQAPSGVLSNDTGTAPLTAVLDTSTTNGTLTLNTDGSFSYTPNTSFVGADSFTYHVTDNLSVPSAFATVTINVSAPPAPTANTDSYTTPFQTTLNQVAPGVLVNDTGTGILIPVVDTTTANGTLTLGVDGALSYVPNAGFTGVDSFTYHVNDTFGGSSPVATVNITVNTPLPPTANADSYSTPFQTTLNQTAPGVLSNDSGTGALTALVDTTTTNGTLTFNPDGSFSYTPNVGFTGIDSFTYHLADAFGGTSAVVTVNIGVGVPPPPAANADTYTTGYQTALNQAAPGVLSNDSGTGTLTPVVDTTTPNGTLTLNADGSFVYTPNAGFTGVDSFTYHLTDTFGGTSTVVTVSIGVGVPPPPIATADSYTTPFQTTLNQAAPGVLSNDGGIGTLSAVLNLTTANGTLTLNADGSFVYMPNAGFSGVDSFTYHVADTFGGVSTVVTVNIGVSITPPTPTPPVPTSTATANATPALNIFDPAISKIGFLQPGDNGVTGEQLEWIVTVSNPSSVSGSNVIVTDTLRSELRIDRVTTTLGTTSINGQTVTVNIGTLAAGQIVQISIFTTVLRGAEIDNTACVTGEGLSAPRCATGASVSVLPSTGETPWWHTLTLSLGIAALFFWMLRRQARSIE